MAKSDDNPAPFWALLLVLLLSGVVINVWQRAGEAKVNRTALKQFPTKLGPWSQIGDDQRFDAATESVLRADDYVERTYASADGRAASLYVGYYATQRNGATYHSPLNCLPGAGWTMSEPALVTINTAQGGPTFQANRFVVQNGEGKQLMVYWYQGRGRSVASEYWGKIYTVLDSISRRRSDGAMVRLTVSIGNSEESANAAALDIASRVASVLPDYVPN